MPSWTRTAPRDERQRAALEERGWAVRILWQCNLTAETETLLDELDGARQERRRFSARELTK